MQYIDIIKEWNFWDKKIETGFKRKTYLNQLLRTVDQPEIVVLNGVRRCGKSTLFLQFIELLHQEKGVPYENCLFVNFEDPRFPEELKASDLFDLLKIYKENLKPQKRIYFFLDEVQKVKQWERFVLTLYDQKADIKFFVSGSNAALLNTETSSLLSGRHFSFRITPLDFHEFLQFKGEQNSTDLQKYLWEYLEFGGFPRVVLEKEILNKKELLISYYETIVEKDVILRHNIKNKVPVKNLVRYVLSNNSQILSTYRLEKVLGISNINIQRYLGYLEEAFIITRVPLFAYSVKKQIYNPQKVFVVDTGLANVAGFRLSENRGPLLETLVFQQLRRKANEVYYWTNGTEIDFLTFDDRRVQKLINVTETVDDSNVFEREKRSLELAKEEFKEAIPILITLYNQSGRKEPFIFPLYNFLGVASH